MNPMRYTWMALLILCGTTILKAQTPQAALAAADARFKALTTYSATMGFVMGDHRDVGKVYYRGSKYHFDFPEDQTIFDGTTTMNWSKEFADISYPVPGDGPDLSAGGIYELHRFPFRFEWADSASTVQRMRLTPIDNNAGWPTVEIGIHRRTGFIEDYTLHIRSGFTIEMKVLDYQLNPVLDDSLFIIDWAFVKRVENGEVPPVEHEH